MWKLMRETAEWKLTRGLLKVGLLFLLMAGSAPDEAVAACGSMAPLPQGGLQWPLEGLVENSYNLNCSNDNGHRGIDINTAPGSPVSATGDGVVAFVGYTPAEGGGTTISIDHPGGLRSTYLHLAEASVIKGETVFQGQQLGKLGTAPLHFGLKLTSDGDVYFNPLELLPAPAESAPPAEPSALQPESQPAPALSPSAAVPQPQMETSTEGTAATFPVTVTATADIPLYATVSSPVFSAAAPATETHSYHADTLFDRFGVFAPIPVREPLTSLQSRGNAEKMPIPGSEYPGKNTTVKHGNDEVIFSNGSIWVERSRLAAAAVVLLLGGLLAGSAAPPLKDTCRPACN